MDYYQRATEEARVPFIYLSQGVSNETFQYVGTGRRSRG